MKVRLFHLSLLMVLVICVQAAVAVAQEPFTAEGIPPSSDYVYRQQYDQVQGIMKLPLAERATKLEAYMKKCHKDAKILQYMEAFFSQIVQDLQKGGQTAQAEALTQKMIQMFPKSDNIMAQQFQAAYKSKDYTKAIELGEQIRAKAPNDAQVLVMLAQSYMATKQTAKVVEISPKIVQVLGPKKGISYVVWMADYYKGQKDSTNAIKYYDMAIGAYPSSVPEGWDANQWKAVVANAYQVRASNAWAREDFDGVIESYSTLLSYDPKNDGAYLFIGLSYWKQQKLDMAQAAFARAVVLGGENSARARKYLEQIYGPLNNNSLDGLDAILEKAKADLGV